MKKQKIRPISILRGIWLSVLLFLAFFGAGAMTFVFIEDEYNLVNCLGAICGFIALCVCLVILVLDIKKGVEFDEKGIKVAADAADKNGYLIKRLQHKVDIEYKEIKDIILKASMKDSLGHNVEGVFVQMPYIVFICSDGRNKAINVYFYNRRQRIKIVDEAIRRANIAGNNLEIESGEILWKKYYKENR